MIETTEFLAWSGKIWSDDERDAFVSWIAGHPAAGDVIPQSGGLCKAASKVQTAIRFDPDVLAALKATGKGWQTRVNEVMREWVAARQAE